MAATTTIRPKSNRTVKRITLPVKASTKILGGTLVATDASGWAVPVTSAANLKIWGVAENTADNSSGGNGGKTITVEFSTELDIYLFNNDTGTPLTAADVGTDAYGVDNQTVSGDDTNRSACGKVYQVTSEGVWLFFTA